MEENTNIEQLVNCLEVFTNEATDAVEKFLASDMVQLWLQNLVIPSQMQLKA